MIKPIKVVIPQINQKLTLKFNAVRMSHAIPAGTNTITAMTSAVKTNTKASTEKIVMKRIIYLLLPCPQLLRRAF